MQPPFVVKSKFGIGGCFNQEDNVNYADIKRFDVANGPGVRISLFVSGCTHHCKNCFNPETWDFSYGKPFTVQTEDYILEELAFSAIGGLTLLGGEPMEPQNQQALLPFVKRVKERFPDKTIWCFTGYDFEKDILGRMVKEFPYTLELISLFDVVVDGEFKEELKNVNLRFKGSSNQRTIQVQPTLEKGEIVYWEPPAYDY